MRYVDINFVYRPIEYEFYPIVLTQGYWLAETTITQRMWQQIMGDNPSHFEEKHDQILPVDSVSYDDSLKFLAQLNRQLPGLKLSLPTEAQWEYACRAGTTTPFNTGNQLSAEQANYDGNFPINFGEKSEYRTNTVAVKSFTPNNWGLYQMHGNLCEWCVDSLRSYKSKLQINPKIEMLDGHCALRGGGWGSLASGCRSASRNLSRPDDRSKSIGLRVTQDEPKPDNSD